MSLSERIKVRMNEVGLSQGELARRVGITQGSIYKLVSGNSKSSKKIVEIAQALGVSAEWLLTGHGKQFVDEGINVNHNLKRDGLRNDSETFEVYDSSSSLRSGEIEIPLLTDIESAFEISPFPFSSFHGATMRLNKDDLSGLGVEPLSADLISFFVTDESMDPILPEGSKIAVNLSDTRIVDGKIYVIDQDGWRRIRKIFRTAPDEVTLKSFNASNFPDEKVSIGNVKVLGRVFFTQFSL